MVPGSKVGRSRSCHRLRVGGSIGLWIGCGQQLPGEARRHVDGGGRHPFLFFRRRLGRHFVGDLSDRAGRLAVRPSDRARVPVLLSVPWGLPPGQRLVGHLRHHDPALAVFESGDQADLLLRAADLIPREPEAVGMSHFRLAVVVRQLFGQEYVLFPGCHVVRIGVFVVEGEEGECPVDDDRLFPILGVEHDPAAEPPHPAFIRLV